jgi:hypothetical protein
MAILPSNFIGELRVAAFLKISIQRGGVQAIIFLPSSTDL